MEERRKGGRTKQAEERLVKRERERERNKSLAVVSRLPDARDAPL